MLGRSRKSFTLFKKGAIEGERTVIVYIEEIPEERTYSIRVEGDIIEDYLMLCNLPERLKMVLREDIVDIVKGYNKLIEGKAYSIVMRMTCYDYFRSTLDKFCIKHGALYEFEEKDLFEE